MKEIAQIYGCCSSVIGWWMRKWGLHKRDNSSKALFQEKEYVVDESGNVWSEIRHKYLKWQIGKKGRARVQIHGKRFQVSRLVAEKFLPNPECKPEIHHKDNNPLNNHVSNLEWVTRSENILHAIYISKTFKIPDPPCLKGENSGKHKFTNEQVLAMREERRNFGTTYQKIADKYDTDKGTVWLICTGQAWTHLPV